MMKRITMREIANGGRIPWGFGIAYYRPWSQTAVCAPIGLHLLISAARAFYFWLIRLRFPEEWETYSRVQWERGFEQGQESGMRRMAYILRVSGKDAN